MSQSKAAARAGGHGLEISRTGLWKTLPGLALVLVVALAARLASGVSSFVPDVVIALVLGAVVGNVVALPSAVQPGIKFTHRYLLRTAIILLGASLSFMAVVRTGGETLSIILICLVVSFSLCVLLARLAGLSGRVGTLLGAGTAICGATAIITVGPLIAATEAEIAYAVGTIFTYNALAVVAYPIIGHALHLTDLSFGTWAGTAVNDTSAVIATGYIYSDPAGIAATIVKLTRTVLLVPLAVGIGLAAGVQQGKQTGQKMNVWKMIPWFVLGFLAMAVLNTVGIFPAAIVKALTELAKFLIVMVLASVGLGMSLTQMRKLGLKPFGIGLLVGAVMGLVSLGLIGSLGIT